jgi:hypothetical protein
MTRSGYLPEPCFFHQLCVYFKFDCILFVSSQNFFSILLEKFSPPIRSSSCVCVHLFDCQFKQIRITGKINWALGYDWANKAECQPLTYFATMRALRRQRLNRNDLSFRAAGREHVSFYSDRFRWIGPCFYEPK